MKNTVEALKLRIRFNLGNIKENEENIKEILKEPVSSNRSEKLNKHFNYNKKLLKENEDAIKLQRSILEYLEKYQNKLTGFSGIKETGKSEKLINSNSKIEIKREDYFELTINKAIEFDNLHPYYKDEDFTNELMAYFINQEDYEMCSKIKSLGKT